MLSLIDLLPWGTDLYLRHVHFPRTTLACNGVFDSRTTALSATSAAEETDYDVANQSKIERLDAELKVLDQQFFDWDYPLLYWLSVLLKPGTKVWELGGSAGHMFFSFQRFLQFPQDLTWDIAELPSAIELGQRISRIRNEPRLSFELSGESHPRDHDIVLTAGTLQYVEADFSDYLEKASRFPEHLLIHYVPAYDGDEYWTVQNIGFAKTPYKILSRPKLLAQVEQYGYSLVDSWRQNREIRIPFAPERSVSHYWGFYFRRLTA